MSGLRRISGITRAAALLALVGAVLSVVGCDSADPGSLGARSRAPAGEEEGEGSGSGSGSGSRGRGTGGTSTAPPVVDGPGEEQQAQPGGYKLTIAPLIASAGCMECHHAGRQIDLSRYPFMAGSPQDTADRLVRCLGTTMPPAPRPAPDAALAARINQWKAEGMKP